MIKLATAVGGIVLVSVAACSSSNVSSSTGAAHARPTASTPSALNPASAATFGVGCYVTAKDDLGGDPTTEYVAVAGADAATCQDAATKVQQAVLGSTATANISAPPIAWSNALCAGPVEVDGSKHQFTVLVAAGQFDSALCSQFFLPPVGP